jgi:hypothetical protein
VRLLQLRKVMNLLELIKLEIIPPPGAYDVENFNIEKAVRVEKEEDPDLAVKKPPFNSSIPRFDLEAKNKG